MSFDITQGVVFINSKKITLSFFAKKVYAQSDIDLNKLEYKCFLDFLYKLNYEKFNYIKKNRKKEVKIKNYNINYNEKIYLKNIEGIYRTSEGNGTYKNSVFLTYFEDTCFISGLTKEISIDCFKEIYNYLKDQKVKEVIYYRRNKGRFLEKRVDLSKNFFSLKAVNSN